MSRIVERIRSKKFTLIAEIGVNYYDIARQQNISPIEAAKLMCKRAKDVGIHAVKFQTYKAENLAIAESPSYWDTSEESTTSQRELFKKYDSFGEVEYRELREYCAEIDIDFCSTAFDYESADYLDSLMDVYKISSSDLTNLPFIEYQAKKGKPIIMSVGAGTLDEMKNAVAAVRKYNNQPLVLCHCVLEYPTPYTDVNLLRIESLAKEFPDVVLGYSDHCKPDQSYDVIKTAYILGARVIEKHFTLDKTLTGNDHYHAMDPEDAKKIIGGIKFIETLLGEPDLSFNEKEIAARLNARRSVVSATNIPSGMVIVEDMLTFKRPGTGISPQDMDMIVGRTAKVDIAEDTIINKDMIK